jgi:hypothetical protein
VQVRNRSLLSTFYTKTDHFTKTGSGQTLGNLKHQAVFLQMMRSMSMPLSLGKEMHRSICAIFMPNNASFYQDRRRINIAKTLKIKNVIFLLQGGPGGGEGGLSPSARQSAVAYRWRQHFRRSANERRCAIRPLVAQRRVRAHPGVAAKNVVLCVRRFMLQTDDFTKTGSGKT